MIGRFRRTVGKAASWHRLTPPIIILAAGVIGGLQVFVFPVENTRITIQAVTEGVFLLIVIIGLFLM